MIETKKMDGNMIGQNRPKGASTKWLIAVVIIILLTVGIAFIFKDKVMARQTATSEYQAVFLTNGQVYFGKLSFKRGWIVLEDIYYLQVKQDLQAAASGDANTPATPAQQGEPQEIQLVKLGSELHGPQDAMYIAKDKILFWENMKDDSKVLSSIKQYKGNN